MAPKRKQKASRKAGKQQTLTKFLGQSSSVQSSGGDLSWHTSDDAEDTKPEYWSRVSSRQGMGAAHA